MLNIIVKLQYILWLLKPIIETTLKIEFPREQNLYISVYVREGEGNDLVINSNS